MMDRDLADLYGVETKALKQAVRRNMERFPSDFMFEMNNEEFVNWRSQFVTSNSDKMGLRYRPMVFTEQGVAMLFSLLRSIEKLWEDEALKRYEAYKQKKIKAKDLDEVLKKYEQISEIVNFQAH